MLIKIFDHSVYFTETKSMNGRCYSLFSFMWLQTNRKLLCCYLLLILIFCIFCWLKRFSWSSFTLSAVWQHCHNIRISQSDDSLTSETRVGHEERVVQLQTLISTKLITARYESIRWIEYKTYTAALWQSFCIQLRSTSRNWIITGSLEVAIYHTTRPK